MKKMNKFALIVGTMLILVSCIIPAASAIALSEGTDGEPVAVVDDGSTEREGILEIEGEVGDTFSVGNLIFEIVSDEEMDRVLSEPQTRASTKRWEISLSGDSLSKDFSVTKDYPYAKVWFRNDLDKKYEIVFTITQGSETGTVVTDSLVRLPGGSAISVYSRDAWPEGTYYANFTCGKADMVGSAACRVASTKAELDV